MIDDLDIRESRRDDLSALEELYPAAFPDEDLLPVVRNLLGLSSGVLSLVATVEEAVIGHVAYTTCGVEGTDQRVELLAPLCVSPDWQRRGVGKALIRAGFDRLTKAGACKVLTLGDPDFYKRSGFRAETQIAPPYRLPKEWEGAWQSVDLSEAGRELSGKLAPPEVWRDEALWLP